MNLLKITKQSVTKPCSRKKKILFFFFLFQSAYFLTRISLLLTPYPSTCTVPEFLKKSIHTYGCKYLPLFLSLLS